MSKPESSDTLVIRRLIPATREEVFAAWIDPASVKEWMCPGDVHTTEAEIDARAGGKFRITMRDPQNVYEHTGEYQVVERPSKLVFTWLATATDHQPTLVTVELFERGGQTELVLTHERFARPEVMQRYKRGWASIAERLARYFEKDS